MKLVNEIAQLRQLLAELAHGKGVTPTMREDVVGRALFCTPFDGCYGVGGWAICVNGSPPRGTIIVMNREFNRQPHLPAFYIVGKNCKSICKDKQDYIIRQFCRKHLPGRLHSLMILGEGDDGTGWEHSSCNRFGGTTLNADGIVVKFPVPLDDSATREAADDKRRTVGQV